jgi:hypothetical protein
LVSLVASTLSAHNRQIDESNESYTKLDKQSAQNISGSEFDPHTEWLLSMRSKNWNVVDARTPMRQALAAERVKNPDFAFAKDGVHPGRAGHWVMVAAFSSNTSATHSTASPGLNRKDQRWGAPVSEATMVAIRPMAQCGEFCDEMVLTCHATPFPRPPFRPPALPTAFTPKAISKQ